MKSSTKNIPVIKDVTEKFKRDHKKWLLEMFPPLKIIKVSNSLPLKNCDAQIPQNSPAIKMK